jgi:hypothetical protein
MHRIRLAIVTLASFGVIACTATQATDAPTAHPTTVPVVTAAPTATTAPTPTSSPAAAVETITEDLPRGSFANSINIDNQWLPLIPGTRWTWEGSATIDGERLDRKIVTTITDLTKVIDGVQTVVAYDESYTDGALDEAELAFFAQADDGTVWYLGEYPEDYEDGVFVEAPFWLSGLEDAKAGIAMQASPRLATLSYSQGWGPKVGWTDRARVFETGSETCVPFGCYSDVLVMDEFNRDSPDAHQLKYYGPGVGIVRIGWAGAAEVEQETLELTDLAHLDAAAMDAARAKARALEAHALVVSPEVYGQTQPLGTRS